MVVSWGAAFTLNGDIGGTIAGNWKQMPTRGQKIGCPLEMTLENIVAQIVKYYVSNILKIRITAQNGGGTRITT